jgi:hypothetical protein
MNLINFNKSLSFKSAQAMFKSVHTMSRLPRCCCCFASLAYIMLLLLCAFSSVLAGCNNSHSHEMAAAARQGSQTAEALADYYHRMAGSAAGMPQARVIEDALAAHMVLPENTAALTRAYHVQAGHYAAREAMARSLRTVYDELDNLAEDKPNDVIGAASRLQSAVVGLNREHQFGTSLHGKGVDSGLIQQHLDKVVGFLFDMQKSGKLRDANADTLSILIQLKEIVDEEKPLYAEDAGVFADEGHSLATAMTKAGFAAGTDRDAFGTSSPLHDLLSPYALQAGQSNPADIANVGQILTTFDVEESYRKARADAGAEPSGLQSALAAQIARQEALAHAMH